MRNWDPLAHFHSYARFRRTGTLRASPPAVLAAGFLALIALGTLLLSLPAATVKPISILSAFFMATSAVTVTGLAVIDTSTDLTRFGQVVLMLLVQAGGIGFVTFAVLASITLGKRMSLTHQALALEAFNQTNVGKINRTALSVLRITIVIELIIMVILTMAWRTEHTLGTSLFLGMFHAITAFNNSGISLFPGSLALFSASPLTLLTISGAIILGGIGFSVLSDINAKRAWAPLMPYTKIMIFGTLALNLTGFVIFWALEAGNPDTLGMLPWHEQALGAWFQSVASRTAGFFSIDIGKMHDSSTLVMMLLMFIGGGSLSTASGIKVGTFIVLLAAVRSYITHRKEVVLLGRSISSETVQKSLALLLVTATMAFVGVLVLTMIEKAPFLSILFEVISALSTTGLSRDLTPTLSAPGQIIVAVLMFAGRIGPLTLVYSIATQRRSRIRYPEAEFQVG